MDPSVLSSQKPPIGLPTKPHSPQAAPLQHEFCVSLYIHQLLLHFIIQDSEARRKHTRKQQENQNPGSYSTTSLPRGPGLVISTSLGLSSPVKWESWLRSPQGLFWLRGSIIHSLHHKIHFTPLECSISRCQGLWSAFNNSKGWTHSS